MNGNIEVTDDRRIREYDVLRIIATLLVVVGHATYYNITTEYGGCDYSSYVTIKSLALRVFGNITSLIYKFHMPLFMMLSGALFYRSKKKYNSLKVLALHKGKQLMIPFFAVSILYCFPLKYISGYYAGSKNVLADFIFGQLFLLGNSHMWFLEALFCDFILCFIIEKFFPGNRLKKLVLLYGINIIGGYIPLQIIRNPFVYLIWFYAGFYFEPEREAVNQKINYIQAGLVCLVFIMLFILQKAYSSEIINSIMINPCMAICGSYVVYCIAFLLREKKYPETVLRNSFGIYLYSDSLNYIILMVGVILGKNVVFVNNIVSGVFYFTRITVPLLVSIGISEILRKKKIKYLY